VIEKALIKIKGTPMSLNKYLNLHWAARKRNKKIWEKKIKAYWLEHGKSEFRKPVKVSIVYRFKDYRIRDFDNYSGKVLLDGLIGTFIEDDNARDWVKELKLRMEFGCNPEETEIEIIKL